MLAQRVKVTIVDIAQEAGVSPATVDRVLNERDGVRRATAEKVIAGRANGSTIRCRRN